MKLSTLAIVSAAAISSITAVASAISPPTSVSPTKANGTFIPGNGIPGDQFTLDNAASGEQIGLKARDRISGVPITQVGNQYLVSAGLVGTNAAWNFDFQFSPGANSTKTASDYVYELRTDMDPSVGAPNFTLTTVPPSLQLAPAGDSFIANPGGGAWSDSTPFVIANSENYRFGFLAGPTFANNGPAQYEINFRALDAATGGLVASSTIFVNVLPEPTTLAALGGAAAVGLRRRRA